MILRESSAVVFSKFSVSDERNGVSCGSTNISHAESQLGKSAFAVLFSVASFLLIGLCLVLLGISSSSEIQKVLLLVLKSFYAPQGKEDNPMA